mmetsp:Transcript_39490/g.113561  ORF Transcript_39490/g.113561 Transcript_39490/m.113561 type:complete len:219 (+) Transcript_39490:527-1183(+)
MINGVKPSIVCAFTFAPWSKINSAVDRLPMTPSIFTLRSEASPPDETGGEGEFTANIKGVQPWLSAKLTIACFSNKWATTCASLWWAAHMSAVLPSLFLPSMSALLFNNSITQSKCPRSALRANGVLPMESVTPLNSALPSSKVETIGWFPFMQDHVKAQKPSPSLACKSARALSNHSTMPSLHCVAAMCNGVEPASSLASRSALCFNKCSNVTTSSI